MKADTPNVAQASSLGGLTVEQEVWTRAVCVFLSRRKDDGYTDICRIAGDRADQLLREFRKRWPSAQGGTP